MSGKEFESAIAMLYQRNGYEVKLTPDSGDYGVDVIVIKKGKKTAIQAKRHAKNIGIKAVQEVNTGFIFYKADHAIVITNSYFTNQSKKLAKEVGVELINRDKLLSLWSTAHKNDVTPTFDLNEYERIKSQIDSVIGKGKV